MCHANGLIKQSEAFKSIPYLDSDNKLHYGFGSLCPPHCSKINESQASRKMNHHLNTIVRTWMKKNIKVHLDMRQKMALESLIYNVGVGGYANSKSHRYLNKGYYERAAQEFLSFNKITKIKRLKSGRIIKIKVLSRGLVKRRVAEYKFWMGIK